MRAKARNGLQLSAQGTSIAHHAFTTMARRLRSPRSMKLSLRRLVALTLMLTMSPALPGCTIIGACIGASMPNTREVRAEELSQLEPNTRVKVYRALGSPDQPVTGLYRGRVDDAIQVDVEETVTKPNSSAWRSTLPTSGIV